MFHRAQGALILIAMLCVAVSFAGEKTSGEWSVRDFGAVGDGKADDTVAFQSALDAAGNAGGGVVNAPPGRYRFKGRLNIPQATTLAGQWQSVPSHMGVRSPSSPRPKLDVGTIFLPTADKGNEDAPAFIDMTHNSVLRGVVIFYEDQPTTGAPIPFPFAIHMMGDNIAVLGVELLNPYKGIEAIRCPRMFVRNVQGQPLRIGMYVDGVTDIGRMENVHWNPYWRWDPQMVKWMGENGEGFVLGRCDWQYVLNTFCLGYKVGYHFIQTEMGPFNGNLLGIGADRCVTAFKVENAKRHGIRITNGEFVSLAPKLPKRIDSSSFGARSAEVDQRDYDPTMVVIDESNIGSVRFVNCAFWGQANQVARIAGRGIVGFSDCTFREWDHRKEGRAAIQASGGTLLVRGCEFNQDAPQIDVGPDTNGAIITDNVFVGERRMSVAPGVVARVEGNLDLGVPLGGRKKSE